MFYSISFLGIFNLVLGALKILEIGSKSMCSFATASRYKKKFM